jgi:hypothetical protein
MAALRRRGVQVPSAELLAAQVRRAPGPDHDRVPHLDRPDPVEQPRPPRPGTARNYVDKAADPVLDQPKPAPEVEAPPPGPWPGQEPRPQAQERHPGRRPLW